MDRKEFFRVNKILNLYQQAVRKKLNTNFWKLKGSSTDKRYISFCKRILKLAKERQIDVEDYINLTVSSWTPSKRGGKFPYLNYLASPAGFDSYELKRQRVKRRFLTADKEAVKAKSPQNFERPFIGAFYSGFRLLSQMEILSFERSDVELFSFFLAFSDIFSPEFFVTHSRFKRFVGSAPNTLAARDLRDAVLSYTKEARSKLEDSFYSIYLSQSRKKVENRERVILTKMFGKFGKRADRIFNLLI